MWPNQQKTADLVTFAKEICNGNTFLCSDSMKDPSVSQITYDKQSYSLIHVNIMYFIWILTFTLCIYMFEVKMRNTRTRYWLCSLLTIQTPCSSVSIVNFKQVNAGWEGDLQLISHILLWFCECKNLDQNCVKVTKKVALQIYASKMWICIFLFVILFTTTKMTHGKCQNWYLWELIFLK